MKPFNENRDELFSEENDVQRGELITFLQKAVPRQVALTAEEQEQILARVRDRLLYQEQRVAMDGDLPASHEVVALGVRTSASILRRKGKRRGAIVSMMNSLAAVMVVGALIGASLLLFVHRIPGSSTASMSPIPLDEGVTTSAGGLSMSFHITSGPYFLSEMLGVDIVLSNQGQKPVFVGQPFVKSFCGYVSGVVITGGNKPFYTIPIPTDHRCPMHLTTKPLEPGQALTVHKYLPLTNSGKQTLMAETVFYSNNGSGQNPSPSPISHPLEKHWPTIQIDVMSDIPVNRKLTFEMEGTQVSVLASSGVPAYMVYLYGISCQDHNGVGMSGNYGWEEIATNTVHEPDCPTKNMHWQFAFGVPGYAVVMGSTPTS